MMRRVSARSLKSAIDAIRRYLVERDFLEAETPMLQPCRVARLPVPGGAFHNALDIEMYLRIALSFI